MTLTLFKSSDREVDGFVLMLALIFNDLKPITWFANQMLKGDRSRSGSDVDAYRGEVSGFKDWTNRHVLSLLHELMNLIKENKTLLGRPVIDQCVAQLPSAIKPHWRTLLAVALTDERSSDPFGKYLIRVRNNVGYHYYQTKDLLGGYDNHFFKVRPAKVSEFAYASRGQTLQACRFYFADAAVQAYLMRVIDPTGELFQEARRTTEQVGKVLFYFVEAYLKIRKRQIGNTRTGRKE